MSLQEVPPGVLNGAEDEEQLGHADEGRGRKRRRSNDLHPPDGADQTETRTNAEERKWVEPPADLQAPQKKKKKKKKDDEELSLHPDEATPSLKKKKKRKTMEEMTSQREDEDGCIAMATDQQEAPNTKKGKKKKKKKKKREEDSETKKTKKKTETKQKAKEKKKKEKKKKKAMKNGGVRSSQENEEEGVNWAQVEELQEFLPNIKTKCVNQIKKLLFYDLHRFRTFRQQGVPARLGRFSEPENQRIRENVVDFMALTGVSSVEKLLFPQRFKEEEATIKKLKKEHRFMERIAEGIPRPCHQVYQRALKMFDGKNHMGRFSEEEVATLIKLHHLHGNNWKLISEKMDRSIYSLQKRFSTIGVEHGAWSPDEERRLKHAVREHLEARTRNGSAASGLSREELSKNLPWKDISQKVQRRSWTQCRTKWLFILEHRMTWYGNVFNRGPEGCKAKMRLINTLYNMTVEDVADINWEEVAKTVGDVTHWSVQRMYNRLKQRKVPHSNCLSFGEIIDFLYKHVLPVLEKRLKASSRWAELQEHHRQDCYQLADIFNSDIEEEEEDYS